jgi:hypothetical protein
MNPIKRGRKRKAIREMRPVAKENPDGSTESHKMSWVGDPSKKRGDFAVFPTITPKKAKKNHLTQKIGLRKSTRSCCQRRVD